LFVDQIGEGLKGKAFKNSIYARRYMLLDHIS